MSALIEINNSSKELLSEMHVQNNQITCSSLDIANHFEKEHKDVLRSIRNLDCPAEFTERNFALSEFKDPTGRKLPCYEITRDGFSFLCMGFTGKKAAVWKVAYINAFNEMEARLLNNRPKTPLEIRAGHIDQIGKLVDQIVALPPFSFDAARSIELMILQESREALNAGSDRLLLEDKNKALREMGIEPGKKSEHPSVSIFWEHQKNIGLFERNLSKEHGLLILSIADYYTALEELSLEPVLTRKELEEALEHSVDTPYLGSRYHTKAKGDCWYFAYPVNGSGWINQQLSTNH